MLTVRTRLHYARKEFYARAASDVAARRRGREPEVRVVSASRRRASLRRHAGRRASRRHVDGCARSCATAQAPRASRRALGLAFAARSEPAELSAAAEARAEASIRWTRITPTTPVRRPFVVGLGLAAACAAALVVWQARAPQARRLRRRRRRRRAHRATLAAPRPDRLEALVTLVGGDVALARGDAPARRLGLDTRLGAADRITTAGSARAAAQWSEGSGFLLYGDAELTLARLEPRTQRLELGRGQILGARRSARAGRVAARDHARSHRQRARHLVHRRLRGAHDDRRGARRHRRGDRARRLGVDAVDRAGARHLRPRPQRLDAAVGPPGGAAARRLGDELPAVDRRSTPRARPRARSSSRRSRRPSSPSTASSSAPTPLEVRRPLGRHYVELTRADFRTQHQWIAVGKEPGELRASLVHAGARRRRAVGARRDRVDGAPPLDADSRLLRAPPQARPVAGRHRLAQLRVGDAGQVTRVDVEQSTLPDPLVAECLRREAAGWSFAQGRNATVVYPFVFRTQ